MVVGYWLMACIISHTPWGSQAEYPGVKMEGLLHHSDRGVLLLRQWRAYSAAWHYQSAWRKVKPVARNCISWDGLVERLLHWKRAVQTISALERDKEPAPLLTTDTRLIGLWNQALQCGEKSLEMWRNKEKTREKRGYDGFAKAEQLI